MGFSEFNKLLLSYPSFISILLCIFPYCLDAVGGDEPVQAQRRSSILDDSRRDTLIASDASLVTDSIIRGKGVARILACLYVQHAACTCVSVSVVGRRP